MSIRSNWGNPGYAVCGEAGGGGFADWAPTGTLVTSKASTCSGYPNIDEW